MLNKIFNEDCLEGMKRINDKSIDMILCDLPYGTTACKWDEIIPFEPLWKQYNRIIKDNGAIVLTANQPFTSKLINSNIDNYKHCWVWDKVRGVGFQTAKYKPMTSHEDVIVFTGNGKRVDYYPIKEKLDKVKKSKLYAKSSSNPIAYNDGKVRTYTHRNPKSIITFSNASQKGKIHPTQKPVALFEYLIKTYTNENEVVLDNCMGSGTTAIACMNTNRNYIGFEMDETYFNLANKRIQEHKEVDA